MSWLKRFRSDESGFTVVEYVMAAVILFIISTGIMTALAYAGTASASTAMHEAGLQLANQRIEQARNMPYDSLGTTTGYPTGTIVTPETVVVATPEGDLTFVVVTQVDWAVDSASNLSSDKNVKVTVSWTTPRPGSVMVETNVVGKSSLTNAGDVKVNVVDSDTNAPVTGATITIKPQGGLTVSKTTGTEGFVRWGKVPAGSITMTGTCPTHYLDMTPVSGAVVLTGELNEWTVQAIRPSSGTVRVVDQDGNPMADVPVTLSGPAGAAGWTLPTGTGSVTTNASGDAVFAKLRKGTYTVSAASSGYEQASSSRTLSIIAGGSSYTLNPNFVMQRITTIKVTVLDSSDNPISGATVTATGPSAVTFSGTTAANGQITSNSMGAIGANKTYTVTATKSGYLSNTGTVTLSQYTQGAVTIKLPDPPPTTIKVIVLNNSTSAPIPGATVTASGVTFPSTTDASGIAISNDMGSIGTNQTYLVTAAKSGFTSNSGSVTFSQYTQGVLTIKLSPPAPTTIKVTVTNNSGTPISGVTVSATGPSAVTFPAVTDANGQATSNDMGAIGSNKTYTVTVRKTGWALNTGTVTLSQSTQGTVTVKLLNPTLRVYGYDNTARTIYVYTSQTAGGAPAYSAAGAKSSVAVSFYLPAGSPGKQAFDVRRLRSNPRPSQCGR